jgi:hypothetical protein
LIGIDALTLQQLEQIAPAENDLLSHFRPTNHIGLLSRTLHQGAKYIALLNEYGCSGRKLLGPINADGHNYCINYDKYSYQDAPVAIGIEKQGPYMN